ncbi:MAG: outer membrane protein assembly factor BamA [Omnitrophica bacterium]|nr:outer membrane protein assembly factor BamA [Candidatus Omnitrophota bacterium]
MNHCRQTYIGLVSVMVSLLVNFGLLAQAQEGAPLVEKLVVAIEVAGNKNISGATILSKIRTKKGVPFSQIIASDDLKRLYALGYFTDIKIDTRDKAEGVVVIFRVTEKPIVIEISLEGNSSIRTEKLEELVKSKIGEFFSLQQLKQDMRDIQKAYEARGFPSADIDYRMQTNEETNEARISIRIEEKMRVKIKDIYIKGNYAFSDKKISKLMRTRQDSLFTSGLYREEVFDLDLERITAFYHENGYLDVQVSSDKSLGVQKKKIYITIEVDEGKQYLVGEIRMQGAVIFPENEIKKRLTMKPGAIFNRDQVRYDIANVQGFYFEKGHISAEIDLDTLINEQTGRIDLVYRIIESDLAYIDKIKIRGNTKTRDIVIRRELRSYPGEAFDGKKLKRSKERLYNLGFFQEISYDTEATKTPDKKDLIVNVKEAKTGEFAFGAGFSSIDRFIGFVEIAQRNFDITNWHTFTGAGQNLRLRAELGTTRREYDLSFTEPWIFGYPLSFGVDGYSKLWRRSGTTGYSFDEQRRGGDIRLGKEFSEFVRANLMYRFENVDISNVPDNASLALKNEVGENTISSLSLGITRDSRDNIYSPTRGLVLFGSGELAGGFLGQDKDFYKVRGSVNFYKTLIERLLLEFKVVAAGAETFSDTETMPIYERFYVGGTNTIRGFKERDVGPKDSSGEPIGGQSLLYGTCELTYPLFELIKLATFYDFGNVWEKLGDFASGDFKYSVGVGVRVKTPMGPVKLDYGYPLEVEPGVEKEGRFHFSMSRGF